MEIVRNYLTRVIRTSAPGIWAFLALWITKLVGYEFTADQTAIMISAVTVVLSIAIYALVSLLSIWFPKVEWSLIIPTGPLYVRSANKERAERMIKSQNL